MINPLRQIMPPPSSPSEAGISDKWNEIEQKLSTQLPEDYKQFINNYGSGKIGNFLIVFNPFSENKHINLLEQAKTQQPNTNLGAIKYLKQNNGDKQVPYAIFPEKGGILPWGVTDNGNILLWKTEGIPKEWTVIIYDGSEPTFEDYKIPMVEFLEQLLSGKIQSKIFTLAKGSIFLGFKSI